MKTIKSQSIIGHLMKVFFDFGKMPQIISALKSPMLL